MALSFVFFFGVHGGVLRVRSCRPPLSTPRVPVPVIHCMSHCMLHFTCPIVSKERFGDQVHQDLMVEPPATVELSLCSDFSLSLVTFLIFIVLEKDEHSQGKEFLSKVVYVLLCVLLWWCACLCSSL